MLLLENKEIDLNVALKNNKIFEEKFDYISKEF